MSGLEYLMLLLCGLTDDLRRRSPVRPLLAPFTPPQGSRTRSPPSRVGSHPAGERQLAGRHPLLPPSTPHLSIPGLNGLDHHRLFGVDFRTPLLRAGFCNRIHHMLNLAKFISKLHRG